MLRPVSAPFTISSEKFRACAARGAPLDVIDVRRGYEREKEKLDDDLHIPLGELEARLKEIVPRPRATVVVYCRIGKRSLTAARILSTHGFERCVSLEGGLDAYNEVAA